MVSQLLTFITGRLSPGITNLHTASNNPAIKQARRPDFYKYTRLPVIRWVKLSLNFELLVNRVMKFLLGQRLINNKIFCTNCFIPYPRNNHAKKLNKNLKNGIE